MIHEGPRFLKRCPVARAVDFEIHKVRSAAGMEQASLALDMRHDPEIDSQDPK